MKKPHTHVLAALLAVVALNPGAAELPEVEVYKSPYCGCCKLWIDHMRAEGFEVDVVETQDMGPVKERVGIPPAKGSCHTAEVDGYFVEGHVPAADVKRLLAEKPAAIGLAAPGMPLGSPGMESPTPQAYDTLLIGKDGKARVYQHHPAR